LEAEWLISSLVRHLDLVAAVVVGLTTMPVLDLAVALTKAVQGAALEVVLILVIQLKPEKLGVLRLVRLAEVAQELQQKALLVLLELLVDLVVAAVVGVALRRLVLVVLVV
jgi:hypothetical protein